MNLIEKATIMHFHRHRISEYGDSTVESLGWKASESQRKRFDVIAELGDYNSCSILDIGCGYGDLKSFLDIRFKEFAYIGIDQMPEFISAAKSVYVKCPETYFYQTDFNTAEFPQVDYVIASGAFGYRCADPEFFFNMIEKMYKASTKAIAFNMLDIEHFPKHDLLTGHDPKKVEAYCDKLCLDVKVINGYLKDDFTVFMHKTVVP